MQRRVAGAIALARPGISFPWLRQISRPDTNAVTSYRVPVA